MAKGLFGRVPYFGATPDPQETTNPTAAAAAAATPDFPTPQSVLNIRKACSVRVAYGANLTLSGHSTNILDGVTLATGDRVLALGQTLPAQNGVYVATVSGTTMTLARAPDMDSMAEIAGTIVVVQSGAYGAGLLYLPLNLDPATAILGTSPIVYTQPFPVLDSGVGQSFLVRVSIAPGVGGAADDVDLLAGTLFPSGFPWPVRMKEAHLYVENVVAGATIRIFTAAGGGGSPVTSAISVAAAGHLRDNSDVVPALVSAGTKFYARRSDNTAEGDLVLELIRD